MSRDRRIRITGVEPNYDPAKPYALTISGKVTDFSHRFSYDFDWKVPNTYSGMDDSPFTQLFRKTMAFIQDIKPLVEHEIIGT